MTASGLNRGKAARFSISAAAFFRSVMSWQKRGDTRHFALAVGQRGVEPFAKDGAAVLGQVFIRAPRPPFLAKQFLKDIMHLLARGVRDDQLVVLAEDFGLGIAEEAFRRGIPRRDLPFGIPFDHRKRRLAEMERQFLVRLAERLLDFLALGKPAFFKAVERHQAARNGQRL